MNTFPQNSLFNVCSKSRPCVLLHASRDLSRLFKLSPSRKFNLLIVYFLLGTSPASNCSWPTFRNPVSVPSSKAGCTWKMELIQGSETSANYNLTPGKYPKGNIQYSNHGESLKSWINLLNYWGSGMAHMWDSKRNYISTAQIGLALSVDVFILIAVCWWSDTKTWGLWRSAPKYDRGLRFKIWDKVKLTRH